MINLRAQDRSWEVKMLSGLWLIFHIRQWPLLWVAATILNSSGDEANIPRYKGKVFLARLMSRKNTPLISLCRPSSSHQIDTILRHCGLKEHTRQCGENDTCKPLWMGTEKGFNEAEASIMKSCTVRQNGQKLMTRVDAISQIRAEEKCLFRFGRKSVFLFCRGNYDLTAI